MKMNIKEFLKKEKYRVRLSRQNVILENTTGVVFALSYVFGPIIGFIFGVIYFPVSEEYPSVADYLLVLLLLLVLLVIGFVAFTEKFVFKTIWKVESENRSDIEIAVAVDQMKETFEKFLEEQSPFITINIPRIED